MGRERSCKVFQSKLNMNLHPQVTNDQKLQYRLCLSTITICSPRKSKFFHFVPSESNSSHTGSTADPAPAGGPDSTNLIWRVLLDERIGADELLINISTNQLLTEGDGLFSSEVGPVEMGLSSLEQDGPFGVNETLEFTLGRKRNDSGDSSYQNKTVQSGGRPSSRSNRTR